MTKPLKAAEAEMREIQVEAPVQNAMVLMADGVERGSVQALETREAGVPAKDLDVPISPDARPRDDRLFLDPASGQGRLWLPRYRLAEEVVGGGSRRYRIILKKAGDDWRLELLLERFAAPQIESKATPETVLDHTLEVILTFDAGSGTRRTLAFDEVGDPDDTVPAALTISRLADYDQVRAALREPARNALLIVRRRFSVAIAERQRGMEAGAVGIRPGTLRPIKGVQPIAVLRPAPIRPIVGILLPVGLPQPDLAFVKSELVTIRQRKFQRHWFTVKNWKQFGAGLFAPSPELPPCGNNKNAARSWVDLIDGSNGRKLGGFCALSKPDNLKNLSFARADGGAQPRTVRMRITDRKANKVSTSNAITLQPLAPPEPTYRVINSALDHTLEQQPFSFPPDLHAYIYDQDGLGDADNGPPQALIRHRESFDGLSFSYFQDAGHRTLIYTLPDRFRLVRHEGDFRPPRMTLTVSQPGESTDSAQAALDYVIKPYTDTDRLEAAREALADRLGLAAEEISFQNLLPKAVTYSVRRPTGLGLVHDERVATPRMLQEPLGDRLQMTLADFQVAFEMMRGDSVGSIGGTVTAEIEGWDNEAIPVDFNFQDMTEDVVQIRAFVGGSDLLIKIANRIESPIVLEQATIAISQGENHTELALSGTEDIVSIAPGAEMEFSCPLPAGFDGAAMRVRPASGIRIEADSEALLSTILDTSTLEYFRTITVEAIPSTFRVPDDPGKQIIAIVVGFENGSSIILRPDDLVGSVRIDYPLVEVMLGNEVPASYRYTRHIVRENGEEEDIEPREAFDDRIFITGMF